MDNISEIFGIIAATCTSIAFVPQVVKAYRERETRALSLGMYLVFSIGVVCWFIYGVYLGSWPMIIGNGFTIACTIFIISLKLRHG